ncbi:MAG: hypothetical protein QOF49_840 [Chloroflexota bacterium]|jgi:hypothetical protein|nr:hypothetical protein [Chloroflexota bacterium]
MVKRILLALALAASLGGAVVACNNPSGTSAPSLVAPTAPTSSTGAGSSDGAGASPSDALMSTAPSSS